MTQIIPAILATSEVEYAQKLRRIEESGLFKDSWVQIDFMDNKFVQNKSIEANVISKYPTSLKLEAHLMVMAPSAWVNNLADASVKRIIAPVEIHYQEIERFFDVAQDEDIKLGLSLNPESAVDKIESFLNKIGVVLVMSVHPGFSGQEFVPEVLPKIKNLKEMKSNLIVGVDGGISPENAKLIVDAGADYLVVGSHLLEGEISKNLEKFQEVINGY